MRAFTDARSAAQVRCPSGLSVFEEEIFRHLTEHVSAEGEFIDAYRQLVEAPDTPEAMRYLIGLLLEDEERRHRLLGQVVAALGNGVAWTSDPDAVPNLPCGAPDSALVEVTNRFLAAERADRRELRALRRKLRPFRDTTAWTLVVELLEHDTAKHIRLLTFIRDHAAIRLPS